MRVKNKFKQKEIKNGGGCGDVVYIICEMDSSYFYCISSFQGFEVSWLRQNQAINAIDLNSKLQQGKN